MPRPTHTIVRGVGRGAVRLLAAVAVLALLVGIPTLLVALVGQPYPTVAQLRAAWTTQQIDTDTVVRVGWSIFLVLWAWFAATALVEIVRVVRWRARPSAEPLPSTGGGPVGAVRHLVRIAVLSSVAATAALGSMIPVRGPAVARAGVPVAASPATPASAMPMEAERTVDTPLGPAREVERGDSYWRIADAHLEDTRGREPSEREVYDYTLDLIELNAPLLGHRDPTLIHPGELVVFTAVPGELPAPMVAPPPPLDPLVPDVVLAPAPEPDRGVVVVDAPDPLPDVVVDDVVDAAPDVVPVAPPAATPPAVAPPPTHQIVRPAVPDLGGHRTPVPMLVGLGAAALVAVGATRLVDARRTRRLRAARVGARLAPRPVDELRAEAALRRPGEAERLARLDLAVRAAAADVAAQGARVVAAVSAEDGAVRLHLDGSAAPADDLWRLQLDSGAWSLPASVTTETLAVAASASPAPCPALVHLGEVADGRLFVDVEAMGLLAIDASDEVATAVTRHIAAALAVSPFADDVRVVTVGLPSDDLFGHGRGESADSLDAALDAAAGGIGSTADAARGSSTFALRAAGQGEAWEPVVVVADVEGPLDPRLAADLLTFVGRGGAGLGVVVSTPVPNATWVFTLQPGRTVLQPLGIEVTPVGLSADDVAALQAVLGAADEPFEEHAEVVSIDASRSAESDPEPFTEPEWSLLVHLLGHVEVVSCDGEPAVFERGKSLELVVWLSQHRRHTTRTGARTALWDLDVRDATFANVVSDARRAMARVVTPPEGEEWIGRTLTEQLPLHAGVVTDAELLERRVAHARGLHHGDAVEVLRPGLELVTGMPFAGTSYLWPDAEGITSALTLLATGAATELAQHYLALGDAEGVFWATGQGLQVLSGHEELIALRMRAHAGAGDLAGVRQEWEAYERALAADPWAAAEPAPKLVALRRDLLSPSLAS